MNLRGKIRNGKVLLDDPKALPEGTQVVVRALKKSSKKAQAGHWQKAAAPQPRGASGPFYRLGQGFAAGHVR